MDARITLHYIASLKKKTYFASVHVQFLILCPKLGCLLTVILLCSDLDFFKIKTFLHFKHVKLFNVSYSYYKNYFMPNKHLLCVLSYLLVLSPIQDSLFSNVLWCPCTDLENSKSIAKLSPSSNSSFSWELSWLYYQPDPATHPTDHPVKYQFD